MAKKIVDEIKMRFADADWLGDFQITLIGLGGIGSWVGTLLHKIGYQLYCYDFDTLETVNFGSQLFEFHDAGKPKTTAFIELQSDLSNSVSNITVLNEKFTEESFMTNIVISAVDNMATRKLAFTRWKNNFNKDSANIFLDGRMVAQSYEVYAVYKEEDFDRYEATLFADSEVPDLPCSFKATPHNAALIAGTITNVLVNYLANYNNGDNVNEVPFHIDYVGPLIYLNLE